MMSLLALTGLAGFEFGGLGDGDDDDAAIHADDVGEFSSETDLLDMDATGTDAEVLDFVRGDLVEGFDPATDTLELEYSAALGPPEVTVTDFSDGTGAAVALNGVVVAAVQGAQGLDPAEVALTPV